MRPSGPPSISYLSDVNQFLESRRNYNNGRQDPKLTFTERNQNPDMNWRHSQKIPHSFEKTSGHFLTWCEEIEVFKSQVEDSLLENWTFFPIKLFRNSFKTQLTELIFSIRDFSTSSSLLLVIFCDCNSDRFCYRHFFS